MSDWPPDACDEITLLPERAELLATMSAFGLPPLPLPPAKEPWLCAAVFLAAFHHGHGEGEGCTTHREALKVAVACEMVHSALRAMVVSRSAAVANGAHLITLSRMTLEAVRAALLSHASGGLSVALALRITRVLVNGIEMSLECSSHLDATRWSLLRLMRTCALAGTLMSGRGDRASLARAHACGTHLARALILRTEGCSDSNSTEAGSRSAAAAAAAVSVLAWGRDGGHRVRSIVDAIMAYDSDAVGGGGGGGGGR